MSNCPNIGRVPGPCCIRPGGADGPQEVTAMEPYPAPSDLRSLRTFLGLASYYRRFVPGFSKVAGPLYALLKKDVSFVWSSECQEAFDHLKQQNYGITEQGAVTPIDAVVSAATGVTGSRRFCWPVTRSRGGGVLWMVTDQVFFVDGHRVTEVVRSLKIIDYYFLLPAPAFA